MSIQTPLYLVELINPKTGETAEADIVVRLDTALERATLYAKQHPLITVSASADEDGVLEGVVFLDYESFPVACVTTYHPERDEDTPQSPKFSQAAALPMAEMSAMLALLVTD